MTGAQQLWKKKKPHQKRLRTFGKEHFRDGKSSVFSGQIYILSVAESSEVRRLLARRNDEINPMCLVCGCLILPFLFAADSHVKGLAFPCTTEKVFNYWAQPGPEKSSKSLLKETDHKDEGLGVPSSQYFPDTRTWGDGLQGQIPRYPPQPEQARTWGRSRQEQRFP